MNGSRAEAEVPLTYTFTIYDPPKPACLELTNGDMIQADEVSEFTDGMEYTVGRHTHHLSPDLVRGIYARNPRTGIAGGGPIFNIRAIPLLPAKKASHANPPTSR